MRHPLPFLFLLAFLAPVRGEEKAALDPKIAALVDPALPQASDPGFEPATLLGPCIRRHGSPLPLVEWIETRAREETDTTRKQNLLWLAARCRRAVGDLGIARSHFDELAKSPAGARSARVAWERARLLDAQGRLADARKEYLRTLELESDEALRGRVHLRLALLDEADPKQKDALANYARGRDSAGRNRAAIALALLGKPAEAAALYHVEGEGRDRFRAEIRVAQWHLDAHQPAKAQAAAWRALESAVMRRDRRYALAILVEAHRADASLPKLIERLTTQKELSADARNLWIDLLRELDRVDEAMRLFRAAAAGEFTVDMRRELLEMCREAGRDKELERAYAEVMREEPERLEWPEGLARHYLEQGHPEEAAKVWREFGGRTRDPRRTLAAAGVLMELGMDELAERFAQRSEQHEATRFESLLFLCDLHRSRGRMREADAALTKLDKLAPPDHKARMWLAEAYQRIGRRKRAADTLWNLREARGPEKSEEDLDMRVAVLLSEVGEEEKALALWRQLWRKVRSIPRRRYVEDRLLTVAARLGKLADIAIDLERAIRAGTASERESGLLVRLYTKVNDPVSAAEILEEYVKHAGGTELKTLHEKARVYLSCSDYHNYEKTIRKAMRVDPEGAPDYLRQLAMSALERGKPASARRTLEELKRIEHGADSAEFEAGVLSLAGLNEDAIAAYRRGIVAYPERIEAYLLLANLLQRVGRAGRAIGMFQTLAEEAGRDDLFTIAIDGLLNLDAPRPVMEWARRILLERLAGRHDKSYLYQLLSDIAEQLNDTPGQLRALENSLPTAGPRRASLLRELMELSRGNRSQGVSYVIIGGVAQLRQPPPSNADKMLAYGRRLLRLGDLVPPDVYLGLGDAFLRNNQVTAAAKTFGLAREVPDFQAFQRQVATSFEKAGYLDEAQRVYGRVLIGQSGDVDLIAKVGELHEARGRDEVAQGLYRRAMQLMLSRRPFSSVKEEKKEDGNRWYYWRPGNVEDFDRHYGRVLTGLLATIDPGRSAQELLAAQRALLDADLARAVRERPKDAAEFTLRRYPRVYYRARFLRRIAFATGHVDAADDADHALLVPFDGDKELLSELVEARLAWGLVVSARRVIESSGRSEEDKRRVRYLARSTANGTIPAVVTPAEASRLLLPVVLAGRRDAAIGLLQRVHFDSVKAEDLQVAPLLTAIATFYGDADSALRFGRHWMVALIRHNKQGWLEGGVSRLLQETWRVLPREHRRSLLFSLADIVISNPKKGSQLLRLIGELQRRFEIELIDAEQVQRLIRDAGTTLWYQAGPLVEMVPDDKRAEVARAIWEKVPKTQKARFLMMLVQGLQQPCPPELAAFLRNGVKKHVASYKETMNSYTIATALTNNRYNPQLALRIATELYEHDTNEPLFLAAYAGALATADRMDKALEIAPRAYTRWIESGGTQWPVRNALNRLGPLLGDAGVDRILAALDAYEKKNGAAVPVANARLTLVQSLNDPQRTLAVLRQAVRDHPRETNLANRLYYQLRSLGRTVEGAETLEAGLAAKPKDAAYRQRVVTAWLSLRNAVRADRIRREGEALKAKSSPVTARDKQADQSARKVGPATVPEIQKALDKQEVDRAGTIFRRMWRGLRANSGNRRIFLPSAYFMQNLFKQKWPRKPAKEEEDPKRYRGGLPEALGRTEAEEKALRKKNELRPAYDVLAEQEFGQGEMRRQLRTFGGDDLDRAGKLFQALAAAALRGDDKPQAVADLLRAAKSGNAGKIDYALLLQGLETTPGALGDRTGAVLDDIAATLNPYDTDQARRLARVQVAAGNPEKATLLYSWAATQLNSKNVWFRSASADEMVNEVCDQLTGTHRLAAIEAVLRVALPSIQLGYAALNQDNNDALVIRTWTRVLGPDDALPRSAELCARIAAKPTVVHRRSAREAAYLFARAGQYDDALRCLENALWERKRAELDDDLPPWYGYWGLRGQALGYREMRMLFPAKAEGWTGNYGEWLEKAIEWYAASLAAKRIPETHGRQMLALLTLRLQQAGREQASARWFEVARKAGSSHPTTALWLADVARLRGDEATADTIERALLARRQLHIERIHEVVARTLAAGDARAALELGERAARYTTHPDLIKVLIAAADKAGADDRAKHWRAVQKQIKAIEAERKKRAK